MSESTMVAVALCTLSGVAEAIFAGADVKSRFMALRLPRYSPPIWAWGLIGVLYYAVCFAVLKALLAQPQRGWLWHLTFTSVLTMMAANAWWNRLFFRRQDLRASFFFLLGYSGLAVGVLILLVMGDLRVALVFLGYVVYLVYAAAWTYQVWQTNRRGHEAGEQGDEADER